MTSPHPRRCLARSLTIGLAAVIAGAALSTPPAIAQEADDSACTASGSDLQERSESSALDLAAACGTEVLIRDSQDYTSRSYAQPDGSTTTEFRATPAWVPGASGEWVDVDTNIEVAEDGSLKSAATVSELEFGAAGETEFVTATRADGEQVSLSWPEPLPEPLVEGSTVTYPEVLPDVDLEVYAGVADFSYSLVVKTPEAAASAELERIELGLETDGLAIAADAGADTAELVDATGESAFGVAAPLMWDSSGTEESAPELAAQMELEIDADSLTVIPDQELLADPDAKYPIYIDPKFYDRSVSWSNFLHGERYANEITCGNGSVMCTGLQAWENDAALGYWRAGMIFNGIQSLADRDVRDAGVWITQTHTAGVGKTYDVKLVAMNWFSISSDKFSDVFNAKVVGTVATDSVPTSNDNYNESDQTIAWTSTSGLINRIQALADDGSNTAPFAVVSGNESDKNQWRKMDPGSATLLVTHAANPPNSLKTAGAWCSTSSPGPTINTLQPVLQAKTPSNLLSATSMEFRVLKPVSGDDTVIATMSVTGVAENTAYSVTVPSGRLQRGVTYYWEARVSDSGGDHTADGEWTANCYFRVNQLPTTPTNLQTENQGCGAQSAPTMVTTTTPKLSAVPNDPDNGAAVKARFRFYAATGDNIWEHPVEVYEGETAASRVPAGLVTADGLYRWRVITDDAYTSSEWSAYCWMRIDTTAPPPPDVVQVSTNPVPGSTVEFDLIGEADVRSFEYSFNSGPVQTASATTGQANISVNLPSTGSIDHTLRVWANDVPVGSVGNSSSPTIHMFTAIAAQPAEALGAWRFDGDLLDDAGEHELAPIGTVITGVDRAGRTDAAAVFDGTGASCLKAGAPVVDTADSFSLAGWVYADAVPAEGAVLMASNGTNSSNTKLVLTSTGRWGVGMASANDAAASWTSVYADTSVTKFGQWTHLAAVYDAAAERLRLYVNGSLVASKEAAFNAWRTPGVFSIGCGVKASGTFSHFTGSVDDAVIFGQPLTDEQIDELMLGKGIPVALQAWYPLRYDDEPGAVPGADYSGRGVDLTAMPATPNWDFDQHGREDSALTFDGTVCPTAGVVPVRTDSAFTVSAWVRLDPDHANSHPRIFSFNGAQTFSVMAKYSGPTDTWTVGVTDQDVTVPDWGDGAVAQVATEEKWTQISVTMDPDNDLLQLFVNGVHSDSGTIAADWEPWRASEFVIGCGGTGDGARSSQWDGAISDVRVWRGALDADEVAATHTAQLSAWPLDQDSTGTDEWGSANLAFNGDVSWEIDRWNECWAAYGLALGGSSWAETAGPVVATDESFTVMAWARVDDLTGYRTVVAQSGTTYGAFIIEYSPQSGKFQMAMPQADASGTSWVRIEALAPPKIDETTEMGTWYHLAAQVDLGAGVMRFFVDGALQGEAQIVDSPWRATGSLTVGAAKKTGSMDNFMVGAIDQVQTWSGVVDPLAIKDISEKRPKYELDPDAVDCDGSTEPPPDL